MNAKKEPTIAASSNAVCNNTKGSYNCTCKQDTKETGMIAQLIYFVTSSFCIPSKALLFLFFHDKMLFIAILC